MRCFSFLALSAFCAHAVYSENTPIQFVQSSNDSADLEPVATSPRFLLNGTELPDLPIISLAPLGPYADISKSNFQQLYISGQLFNVDVDNTNDIQGNTFAYISCDSEAYPGYLNASDVLNFVLYGQYSTVIVILYSEHSNHCNVSNLSAAPGIDGILTTVNPMAATALANLNLGPTSKGTATILPDLNSYTNGTGSGAGSSLLGPGPTTAVAMIILYSITGIITALFIVIIITGAIRAHRHPERYGPRTFIGRGRQSRAKGIARAMLETLPIVKFGDHEDLPAKPAGSAVVGSDAARDIEMSSTATHDAPTSPASKAAVDIPTTDEAAATSETADTHSAPLHDGKPDDSALGCSICTEDFSKGEEVRVLPCNHKFHPDCVDPWLLNVSGTCPLCRIDLRPEDEREEEPPAGEGTLNLPPPLSLLGSGGEGAAQRQGRRGTIMGLRAIAHGTPDERIDALRRYRMERRRNNIAARASVSAGAAVPEAEGDTAAAQAESRGVTARLRDRLRVRTTRMSEGLERLQRAM